MRVRAAVTLVPLLAGACTSHSPDTLPDRPLFRLAASGVAPVAVDPREAAAEERGGPLVPAYSAEFHLSRGDGTTLVAPRLTAFAGQRANIQVTQALSFIQDFDVEVQGDAWIADPIIGQLCTGWALDATVLDVEGRADEAAVAYSLRGSDLRRPIPLRSLELAPRHRRPVTVQLPRVESVAVRGAQRLALGEVVEMARLPDPAGAGEVVVRVRVERVMVPASNEARGPAGEATGSDEETRQRDRTMRMLGDAAARGASRGSLRLAAVRLPPGVESADAAGVERLATLRVDSVVGEGVEVSNRLLEAYLADWEFAESSSGSVADPVIGQHDSGITAAIGKDGGLRVAWRTTPAIERFTIRPFDLAATGIVTNAPPRADASFSLPVDRPRSTAVERTVPLAPGRTLHPIFRLPDGGTAAVVVEFEPAR